MHGRPAGAGEEVEADDAVAVDVWMDGDGAVRAGRRGGGGGDECDFGGFWSF